ncbi:MAG: hypothetical protein IPL08_02595 [Saprospiraceae bacterium]|nr:hypothetical protein [Saprospiraceae bacterium]
MLRVQFTTAIVRIIMILFSFPFLLQAQDDCRCHPQIEFIMSDCVRQGLPSDISFFIAGNSLTDISKPMWVKLFADDQLILDKEVFLSANGFYSETVKYTPTKDVKYFLEFHCVKDKCFTQTSSVQKTIPDYIIQTKDISCADRQDGEVKLMPETVKNLDLVWESGEKKNFVTNMHHGVYNVTVQYDNNCVEYKTIELNQPQPITIIPNTISTTCGTSTVNYLKLEVNGGNGPFKVDWDHDGMGDFDDEMLLVFDANSRHDVMIVDAVGCSEKQEIVFKKGQPEVISPKNGIIHSEEYMGEGKFKFNLLKSFDLKYGDVDGDGLNGSMFNFHFYENLSDVGIKPISNPQNYVSDISKKLSSL